LKKCSQVHKNYENLEASKHNLWVKCEGYEKNLKLSNDKLEQYKVLQKQPQGVITLHQEIEFLRETLSKFFRSTKKLYPNAQLTNLEMDIKERSMIMMRKP